MLLEATHIKLTQLKQYCQETQGDSLLGSIEVHQKGSLDLAIHCSCLKALNDVLSREFKVKSPPPNFLPRLPRSLARA